MTQVLYVHMFTARRSRLRSRNALRQKAWAAQARGGSVVVACHVARRGGAEHQPQITQMLISLCDHLRNLRFALSRLARRSRAPTQTPEFRTEWTGNSCVQARQVLARFDSSCAARAQKAQRPRGATSWALVLGRVRLRSPSSGSRNTRTGGRCHPSAGKRRRRRCTSCWPASAWRRRSRHTRAAVLRRRTG